MEKAVCISAGHGAGDSGAVNKELRESELAIKISKRASEIIRKHGVGCLYVPDDLTLIQTIAWINERASQISIAVEVHINAGGGSGVEAWNFQGNGNESDKLSQFLADACSVETGLYNRGIFDETKNRWGRLGFVHDTLPIAVLVECGFIDGDASFLSNPSGIERMARGVARGCLGYIGVTWNPTLIKPIETAPADNLYRIILNGQQLGAYKVNPLTTIDNKNKEIETKNTRINTLVEKLKQINDISKV